MEEFWGRSHVFIGPGHNQSAGSDNAPPFKLNQQYVIFRYLQLIQGNGSTAVRCLPVAVVCSLWLAL